MAGQTLTLPHGHLVAMDLALSCFKREYNRWIGTGRFNRVFDHVSEVDKPFG
jgi:hypothetical protein